MKKYRKHKKHILSIVLVVALLVSLMPSNLSYAASSNGTLTNENASFANSTFSMGKENIATITAKNGVAYGEFALEKAMRCVVKASSESGNKVSLYLYDSSGDCLTSSINMKEASLNEELSAGVTYTIGVRFSDSQVSSGKITVMAGPYSTEVNLDSQEGLIRGIGNTIQINPTTTPAMVKDLGLVSYESKDESVATVDANGLVTATGAGETTIKVSNWDGPSTNYDVTVISTDCTLSDTELTLNKESTARVNSGKGEAYFTFTPSVGGKYEFKTSQENGANAYIFVYTGTEISKLTDYTYYTYGTYSATLNCDLVANTKYTIRTFFQDSDVTGDIKVLVRKKTNTISVSSKAGDTIQGVGNTLQLTATVDPSISEEAGIQWKSSDTSVATVDQNGLVTAVGEGNTYITASTWDEVSTQYEVKVTSPKLHLSATSATMYINTSFTLSPTLANTSDSYYYEDDIITSYDSITYTSGNKKVATVTKNANNEATVNAVGPGSTKITVTVTSNGKKYTATCNVKVRKPDLNTSTIGLYLQYTFKLKVYHGSGKAKWSSSNKKVATVSSSGVVKAKKKGKATITCKINGVSLKCKVQVFNPELGGLYDGVTAGFSGSMYLYGAKSTKGAKWSSSNTKVAKVKKGKVYGRKPGKVTITCKIYGVTLKRKIQVYKNEYVSKPAKMKDLYLDRIYYQVVKTYFSGGKLKVKLKIYNTYADRKLKKVKLISIRMNGNGKELYKRYVNKKVNIKAYKSKTFTFTMSKNAKLKRKMDLRSYLYRPSITLQTAYYNYNYTY